MTVPFRLIALVLTCAVLALGTTGCATTVAQWIVKERNHQGDVALARVLVLGVDLERELVRDRGVGIAPARERDVALVVPFLDDPLRDRRRTPGRPEREHGAGEDESDEAKGNCHYGLPWGQMCATAAMYSAAGTKMS